MNELEDIMYKEIIVASSCILWHLIMIAYLSMAAGRLPVMVM